MGVIGGVDAEDFVTPLDGVLREGVEQYAAKLDSIHLWSIVAFCVDFFHVWFARLVGYAHVFAFGSCDLLELVVELSLSKGELT